MQPHTFMVSAYSIQPDIKAQILMQFTSSCTLTLLGHKLGIHFSIQKHPLVQYVRTMTNSETTCKLSNNKKSSELFLISNTDLIVINKMNEQESNAYSD